MKSSYNYSQSTQHKRESLRPQPQLTWLASSADTPPVKITLSGTTVEILCNSMSSSLTLAHKPHEQYSRQFLDPRGLVL